MFCLTVNLSLPSSLYSLTQIIHHRPPPQHSNKPVDKIRVIVLVGVFVSQNESPENVAVVHLEGEDVEVPHELLDAEPLLVDVGRVRSARQAGHGGEIARVS